MEGDHEGVEGQTGTVEEGQTEETPTDGVDPAEDGVVDDEVEGDGDGAGEEGRDEPRGG